MGVSSLPMFSAFSSGVEHLILVKGVVFGANPTTLTMDMFYIALECFLFFIAVIMTIIFIKKVVVSAVSWIKRGVETPSTFMSPLYLAFWWLLWYIVFFYVPL